jgi:hypothetical protein
MCGTREKKSCIAKSYTACKYVQKEGLEKETGAIEQIKEGMLISTTPQREECTDLLFLIHAYLVVPRLSDVAHIRESLKAGVVLLRKPHLRG